MHFGCNNKKYQYSLGVEILNISNCEKILGLLIDDKLTFKDHVYKCLKKASQICNMILQQMYIILKLYRGLSEYPGYSVVTSDTSSLAINSHIA